MAIVEYIAAPLIGGIIGYITNDIAIRMLFRPHTAKYIFGIHIPFTPGIIPKEKERIAEAIGDVISKNLMNQEVLQHYLLSDEMINKVRSSVENFFDTQKVNNETVEQFLSHYLSKKEISSIVDGINSSITVQIEGNLNNPELGVKIAHLAMEHLSSKLNNDGAQELVTGIGGAFGGIGGAAFGAIAGRLLSLLREPTERFLANKVNEILQDNGATIISNMLQDESNRLLSTSVSQLLSGKDEQIFQLVTASESIYKTIIQEHLPRILQSIDISKIVRERINEMDVNETEKLILQVMNKELKAIVWLGALLGLIMGCVNIFV